MDRERGQQIKALLTELKVHLKTTKGNVRSDAAKYLAPVAKKKSKKKRRSTNG